MAIGPKLELRQSQSLVMTQQLQQSIKLLQLSAVELEAYINDELEKNPLLAVEEGDSAPAAEGVEASEAAERAVLEREAFSAEAAEGAYAAPDGEGDEALARAEQGERVHDVREAGGDANAWDMADRTDFDNAFDAEFDDDAAGGETSYASHHHDSWAHEAWGSGVHGDGEDTPFVQRAASPKKSLREHVLEQWQVDCEAPRARIIGMYLIDLIDEGGYIREPLASVAQTLGATEAEVEATLMRLQRCDPPGVCARNVAECLEIQLREQGRCDPTMQALLAHLPLIERGEWHKLEQACGVDGEELRLMIAELKTLNPRPGADFAHEEVSALIPDVVVEKSGKSRWHIELNPDALPRVLVNERYYTTLSAKARNKQEHKYLSEQWQHANWLVKALDQRARTLLKVATALVKRQDLFLRHGIHYLKPLTLKDVAEDVSMHPSTISRVTTQKYMLTPRGVFELKYFFTSSLNQQFSSEEVSSRTVQHLIKEMIDAETPQTILSDDAIASALKQRGIDVARRTVAKYREGMHIPSSTERRRSKQLQASVALT